ncbi:unnamed protein product [Sphagnum balticum]
MLGTSNTTPNRSPATVDPAIKLFGANGPAAEAEEEEKSLKSSKGGHSDSTVTTTGTETVLAVEAAASEEGGSMKHKKEEEEGGHEIGSQGKTLKKPDKPAQCPRCDSLDTKFCYYNNYDVNQPRHFCKNCQRYWTAGGTLRNVPIGAGRRKSKHVQACHGAVANGSVMSIVRPDSQETAQQLLPYGEISLMGGFQVSGSACQKSAVDGTQNDVGATGEVPSNMEKRQGVDECVHSLSEPHSIATQEAAKTGGLRLLHPGLQPDVGGSYRPLSIRDGCGAGSPFGFYNGAWPYGFNVGWTGAVPTVSPGAVGPGQLLPGNGITTWNPPPTGVWTGAGVLPWASLIPGMPGSPWVVPPGWGGGWTVPLPWAASATASTVNGSVQPTSRLPGMTTPVLGKHPREQLEGRRVDGALWAPKTLRTDDPKEAAQSSVWNALGMPNPPSGVCSKSSNQKQRQK